MNFGNKSFTPRPPDKGAFPLDHLGESHVSYIWWLCKSLQDFPGVTGAAAGLGSAAGPGTGRLRLS